MDLRIARQNMIEHQIKPLGILEPHILDVLMKCPREEFVPISYKEIAYADTSLPIGNGKVMLAPHIIARLLQALHLSGTEHVLEIDSGTGYLTALLAQLALHVTGLEPSKALAAQASQKLSAMTLTNYEIINGTSLALRGSKGFDVMVLTGSVPYLPKQITQHLKIGGRIFAVVGHAPCMHACIFTRMNEEEWSHVVLFETVIPPLKEIVDAPAFEF